MGLCRVIRYYKRKLSLIKYDKLWVEAGIGREEGNAKVDDKESPSSGGWGWTGMVFRQVG